MNNIPNGLFAHQVESWNKVKSGKNVVISTGTSSGKSLCFYLPILEEIIRENNSTSLLLFPTKALTSDQLLKLTDLFIQNKFQSRQRKTTNSGNL